MEPEGGFALFTDCYAVASMYKKNAIERHDFMTHLRFVFLFNAHARYFHTTHREFYLSMGFIRSMLRSERLVANVSRDYYRSLSGNTVVRLAGIDIAAIYHYNSTALTLLFALIVFIFFYVVVSLLSELLKPNMIQLIRQISANLL